MKITCSKRDDLMRARYDYDALTEQYDQRVRKGEQKARLVVDEAAAYIEDEIRRDIGSTSLNIRIDVRTDWSYDNGRDVYTWRVKIEAHEDDKYSNDNVSLAWHWGASLDGDGNVVKESGSWSGLQAITPEQIDDLEESIRVLKLLNSMDWKAILGKAIPDRTDYIDKEAQSAVYDRKHNRPDFERQLLEAEIDDAIQAGEWIKMKGRPETDYYRGDRHYTYWCKIDSMSDKFVKCHIAYERDGEVLTDHATDERISKQKLFNCFVKPIETRQA